MSGHGPGAAPGEGGTTGGGCVKRVDRRSPRCVEEDEVFETAAERKRAQGHSAPLLTSKGLSSVWILMCTLKVEL